MRDNPYQGAFIVLEGIDGSGKSLQVDFIVDWLVNDGPHFAKRDVIKTHEPSDSTFGREIKKILSGKHKAPEDPFAFQELYIKDRAEHMRKVIIPNLKKGRIVLSDRSFLSTFAYGAVEGLSFETIKEAHEKILGEDWIMPDATLVINMDPSTSLLRLKKRSGDKGLEYFEKKEGILKNAAREYLLLKDVFPRTHVVSGDRPIAEVSEYIHKILAKEPKIVSR